MTPVPTFTIAERAGPFFVDVVTGREKVSYPAASRLEAEVIVGLEKNKLAGKQPC